MKDEITVEDLDFILTSLKYSRLKFEDYQHYPSYEFKQSRLDQVGGIIRKVSQLKKELIQMDMPPKYSI